MPWDVDGEPYLSRAEAERLLAPWQLKRKRQSGHIHTIGIGRRRHFRKTDVERVAAQLANGPRAKEVEVVV